MDRQDLQQKITDLESQMNDPHFWDDKARAQGIIKEIGELKDELAGVGKYDRMDAVMTIFAGAGGDDAEDFTGMLLRMYQKFVENQGWTFSYLHEHRTDHGGYRNVTIEISGKNVYGTLKSESGVHRLVRLSPFNANQKRHTSFAMVEVVPKLETADFGDMVIPTDDLKIELSRASGPGGQNVNKRETAVRVVHIPTNISAQVDGERSQERNKEKAIGLVTAKLVQRLEEQQAKTLADLKISKETSIEWGSQIRSYVLHPYKLVKDHRSNVEVRDVDSVLVEGNLEPFLEVAYT